MSTYARLLKQMVETVSSSLQRQRLCVTATTGIVLVTSLELGAGGVLSWAMEKGDVPSDEVEPGVCRFDCNICKCSCQATFDESKCNQISNCLRKNVEKAKPIVLLELQREGGYSLFFDYVKNNLDNYSVQEFHQVNSCSKNEIIQDVFTKTSIDILNDTLMQCNSSVMQGLQGIRPGCRTNVEVTPIAGGKKVSISIQQARKELKGQRKNLPEVPSLKDHTPPASNFVSNAGNCAHRNELCHVVNDPHRETAAMMTGSHQMAVSHSPPIMERVQDKVLDKFLDTTTTPQTKRVVEKVHAQLTHKDAAFTMVVDCFQDIQSLQEISDACIKLQHAME
jgi:hypothetical protein